MGLRKWIQGLFGSTKLANAIRRGRNKTSKLLIEVLEDRRVLTAFGFGTISQDQVYAMAADGAGNVFVAGTFRQGTMDVDPSLGTTSFTNANSGDDAFLAKYDSSGTLLWAGQLVDSTAKGLAVDGTGNVYMTGGFFGSIDFDLGGGTSTMASGALSAAYVAKYSPTGTLLMAKRLGGGTSGVHGESIALDIAGNIYSAGVFTRGDADMDPGGGLVLLNNASGNADTYISKLNSAGDFVWAKEFSNDPSIGAGVWPSGIGVDQAQNVYLTGIFVGRVDFNPAAGDQYTSESGDGGGDGYVVKLTAAGDLGYLVPMGSPTGREDGNGIAVDPNGGAYVTGQFSNTMIIGSPPQAALSSAGNSDIFVVQIGPTGTVGWARSIGSSNFDGGLEITYDGVNNLYLTGYFGGTVDFDPLGGVSNLTGGGGFTDVFALRMSLNGTFVNAWAAGGPGIEFGEDIAVNSQGTVFVGGRFDTAGDFEFGPGVTNISNVGSYDAFVSIFSQASTNRAPTASNGTLVTNEDTPANGTLVATDPDLNPLTYSIVSQPSSGTVQITNTSTGAYTYSPALNYNGPASFTFKANDGLVDSNVATVNITVNAVNDAPVASNGTLNTNEDTPVNGNLVATDVEGSPLTYSIVTQPANGQLTAFNTSTGAFTYRPAFNYNGPDSFTFRARDGSLDSNTATISITVNPINDAPRPTPVILRVTINEDTPTGGQLTAIDPEGNPFTFNMPAEFAPQHGTATVAANGVWTYTPAPNYFGTDIFGYRVTDSLGASDNNSIGAVEITILPVNDAPAAVDNSYNVNEDTSMTVGTFTTSYLHMFSNPGEWVGQGQVWDFTTSLATFAGGTNFDNGVNIVVDPPGIVERWDLNFAAPGEVQLTPGAYPNAARFPFQAPTEAGLDVSGYGRGLNRLRGSFTVYDVAYGVPGVVTRFAATFIQQDHLFDDTLGPPLRGAIVFNSTFGAGGGVLVNDTDPENDVLPIATLVSGPAHGTVTWNGDGSFIYTPFPDYSGPDTMTYRTTDGFLQSNVATINITVNAINDAPRASDGSLTTSEDVPTTGTLVANDPDGNPLTFTLVNTANAHGTVQITNATTGAYSYTPALDYNGPASFTFKANDGLLDSNIATVNITVNPFNDAPRASNGTLVTNEDTSANGTLVATDNEGSALTYSIVSQANANGTVQITNASTGAYSYTPATNYNGPASFTFKANDGALDSNIATVNITVNAVNDAPQASNGSLSTNEDVPTTGTLVANDVDGNPLTYSLVSTANAHGTVQITNATTGAYSYTPALDYNGPASFTFKASDGLLDSNIATVNITVNPVNDAPRASNGTLVTNEDTSANGTLVATDVDNVNLTYSLVSTANAHGTVQITNASTGAYSYTPALDYNGPASFTFKANDGLLDSNVATVNITVNPVNDAPAASNGSLSTNEDVPTTGTLVASDVDGNPLTYSLVSTANAHGTVQITNATTGAYSYTPALDYNGPASFTFKASDGLLDSNIATVNITVNPVNDAPRASDGSLTTNEDTSANGTLVATDVDNANLTYALVSTANAHGTVQITNASTGAYTYTPALDYNGPASFTFKANDGLLDSNIATVNITVNPVNDAPLASNGSLTTNEDVPTTGTLVATDVEGNPLTYSLLSIANAHGTVQITNATTGAYSYSPALDYNGPASFTFKASDGLLDSNIATVNITVNPVNDAPRASDGSLTTNEDTGANGTLAATDVDNANLTYALVSTANAHGTVQITNASTGAYSYTPALDYNGPASFTFKASDGLLDSNIATVNITINPVNDAPLASNGSLATNEDVPTTGNLVANDVDGNPLTYSLVSVANAHGTVQITNASTGAYSYTPAANYNGPASFTFKANDGTVDSNIATVNITVNAVNDRPTLEDDEYSIPENTPNTTPVGSVTGADIDGDTLAYSIVGGNTGGAFAIHPVTGVISVANSAALDYETTPVFNLIVRATDPGGLSADATVRILLTDQPDAPRRIGIDIRPGDSANTINIKSNGHIEVAILSTATFNAQNIDVNSLRFGRTGTEDSLSRNPHHGTPRYKVVDVNGDGRLDIVVTFEIEKTGFQVGDALGTLTGRTLGGEAFIATDLVTIRNPGR